MAITLGDIYVNVRGNDSKFGTDLNKAEQQARGWASRVGGVLSNTVSTAMGFVAAQGIMRLTDTLVSAGPKLISLGSDAEEMMGKFNVVFGDQSDRTIKKLDEMTKAMGRSKFEARGFASSFQDTFVPMGFARDKAADLSMQLTELTYDVSSFNNTLESDTARDFQSALVGNHETVRKYGIVITEAALGQELMNMGIAKGTKEATEQQKVQARLNLIMKGTADAQGDAIRTSTSWSNMMRRLKSAIGDTAKEMGIKLLPVFSPLLADFAKFAQDVGPKVAEWFAKIIDTVVNSSVLSRMKEFAQIIGRDIIGVLRDLKRIGGSLFVGFFDSWEDADWGFIIDKLGVIGKLLQGLAAGIGTGDIGKSVAMMGEALSDVWNKKVMPFLQSLPARISDVWDDIHPVIMQWADKFWAWLFDPEKGVVVVAVEKLNELAQAMIAWAYSPETEAEIRKIGDAIATAIFGGIDALIGIKSDETSTNLSSGLATAVIKMGQAFAHVGELIAERIFAGLVGSLQSKIESWSATPDIRNWFSGLYSGGGVIGTLQGLVGKAWGFSEGGYAGRGMAMLGEDGRREFVLNADTTRALEARLGSLTQQNVLGAVGVNGTLNVNFGGAVPAGVSPGDVRQEVINQVGNLFQQHARRSR